MAEETRYNWTAIRDEYTQTNQSLRQLATKYGMDIGVIGRKAAEDEWVEKREQFRNELSTRNRERTLEKASEDISEERARLIRIVDAAIGYATRKMTGEKDKNGNLVVPPSMKVNMRDLLDATKLKLVLSGETVDRSEIKGMGVTHVEIRFVNESRSQSDNQAVGETVPIRPSEQPT